MNILPLCCRNAADRCTKPDTLIFSVTNAPMTTSLQAAKRPRVHCASLTEARCGMQRKEPARRLKRSAQLHELVLEQALAIAAFHRRRCHIQFVGRWHTCRCAPATRAQRRHRMMPTLQTNSASFTTRHPRGRAKACPRGQIRSASDQPLVTIGGALPLPTPTQPETLTATRVATSANRSFFIGIPSGCGLCDELKGVSATRTAAVNLVLKSHSAHPNR
jgi:hypothetical protein